jgi:hypothetical protein
MTKNQERLLNWLLAEHNGLYEQSFGTDVTTEDLLDARNFAEKMRLQIGDSGIATVEQRNTKVFIKVTESLVHK